MSSRAKLIFVGLEASNKVHAKLLKVSSRELCGRQERRQGTFIKIRFPASVVWMKDKIEDGADRKPED